MVIMVQIAATSCYTLKVQLGTATRGEFTKALVVSVYPNPVEAEFKVDMGGYAEPVSLVVTDMFGRKMMAKNFTGSSSINAGNFAAGVYMLTITDKNGVTISQQKIIKE